ASLAATEFIEDCCDLGDGLECDRDKVHAAWVEWSKRVGRKGEESAEHMVRLIRAIAPKVESGQARRGADRIRVLKGIDLYVVPRAAHEDLVATSAQSDIPV